MDKNDYDVLSPVNSKNVVGRVIWVLASLISILFLLFSFIFENAILIIIDGLIPLTFFIYRFIKKKEYPFYYYLICSCGLYLLYWDIFLSPDFNSGVVDESLKDFFEEIIYIIIVISILIIIYRSVTKYTTKLKNNSKLNKFYLSLETVILVIFILGTEFLSLNVVLDRPFKEDIVYITDIYYNRGTSHIYYKYSLDDKDEYVITSDSSYEPTLSSLDGVPMGRIESGKGAFGIEWKEIIE